jgi:hypothetical protein
MVSNSRDAASPICEVHIQVLSRLFRREAPAWEAEIKAAADGRDVMWSLYRGLRRAISAEMNVSGSGPETLERFLRRLASTPSNDTVRRKSRAALDLFEREILPHILLVEQDFVADEIQFAPVQFGGVLLKGGFHALLSYRDLRPKLVYFHASEWTENQTQSFVELLTIIAEDRHGMSREDVLFLDLAQNKVIKPAVRFERLRRELIKTARHYARLFTV